MLSRLLFFALVLGAFSSAAQTPGCTDLAACNYNSLATEDDGSCCLDNCLTFTMQDSFGDGWNGAEYTIVINGTTTIVAQGGLDGGSQGVDELCLPDGSYILEVTAGSFPAEISWTLSGVDTGDISGSGGETAVFNLNGVAEIDCNDTAACNYDPSASGNSECLYPGCIDPAACNYDATATCQIGDLCTYPAETYFDCEGNCLNDADGDGVCDEIEVSDCNDPSACNFNPLATDNADDCCYNTCVTLVMEDSFGDGWNGAEYIVTVEGTTTVVQSGTLTAGSLQTDILCMLDGCYTLEITEGSFPTEISWTLLGTAQGTFAGVANSIISFSIGSLICTGCNDPLACNYSASATEPIDCVYPGCTDLNACNYDASAGCQADAVCTYPSETYLNCDGSCVNDTDGDGVCDELEVMGCVDPVACNYDATATEDNSLCCYDNCLTLLMFDSFGDGWNGAVYNLIQLPSLDTLYTGTMQTGSEEAVLLCSPDGCYKFEVDGGVFPSEIEYDLVLGEELLVSGFAFETNFFGIGEAVCAGCGDDTACNYDPEATSNENCVYPGCNDVLACNYDPEAGCYDVGACNYPDYTWENCDGTCISDVDGDGICDEVDNDGCTYELGCNYNPYATLDDGSCDFGGCMDPTAWNYDATTACDNGSCIYAGCMYPGALNYDPSMTVDDGSCQFSASLICPSDLNNDGVIDALDILILIPQYGLTCEP